MVTNTDGRHLGQPTTASATIYGGDIIAIKDPIAFEHLGVDPLGDMTYTGNNQFNYFPEDFFTNDDAQVSHFVDDELRKKLGLPDPEENKEEPSPNPHPPLPTYTTTPKEMVRDNKKPIVISTTPDVAYTPRGNATPPVPYNTTAKPADDRNFTSTVRATGNKVMVDRSEITRTSGAEQGVANGIISGTINAKAEPLEHSSNVRAEGSYIIRNEDMMYMNNRNNFGQVQYVEDLSTHSGGDGESKGEDDEGFWDSLWKDAQELNEEYALLQRGVGLMQAGFGIVEGIAGIGMIAAGVGTSWTGVGGVLGIGGGALVTAKAGDDIWAGLKTIWSGDINDSYLDQGIAEAGNSLELDPNTITVVQAGFGMIGNLGNFAKEGVEQGVKRGGKEILEGGAEEVGEKTAKGAGEKLGEKSGKEGAKDGAEEVSENSAKKNGRVSGNCYKIAMAAIVVARETGEKYVGGPWNGTKAPGYQAHHVPPSRTGGLNHGRGPTIQMDISDHQKTMTYDNKAGNKQRRNLAAKGKIGFLSALQLDIADVKRIAAESGNPNKYDKAIAMVEAYAGCLVASGEIK